MNKRLIISITFFFVFSFIFIFNALDSSAAPIVKEYSVSIPEFTVRDVGGKAYYEIKGFGLNTVLGLPLLPHKKYYFEIPFNAKDVSVSLVSTNSRSLGQVLNLAAFQGMAPNNDTTPVKPNLAAARAKYTLATFPEGIFKNLGESFLKGHRLICVGINPLIQNLRTNELKFNEVFTIRIQYTLDETKAKLNSEMQAKRTDAFDKLAENIIYNYSENQALKSPTQTQSVSFIPIDQVPIKYAIITLAANVNAAQPLADWKTKKGIPAKVYTVEDIEANYTGADLQEKIRKFLTEASVNPPNNPFYSPKFDWLLIAGEQGAGMPEFNPPPEGVKLPSRYVGPVTWHPDPIDTETVPADYYFADCAGGSVADSFIYDWDTNNNGIYGEPADDIRWILDTYVGRIPVNSYSYISKVVNKIINYEKTPPVGSWTKEALLCGGKLDDYTDGASVMQYIKNDFLDAAGLTSFRLNFLNTYPKDANLTEANFISYASAGKALIEWSAHGSVWTSVDQNGASAQRFVYFMNNIANGSKQSVVFAESCDNGKFDLHTSTPPYGHIYCLGDSILRGEDTIPIHDWGVAFIGNSRLDYYWIGWNSPSQGGGLGELYRFNEQIFSLGKSSVGQALYDMKLDMVNDFAGNGNFDPNTVAEFRKNLFTLNLLGDPEMPIWTDTPQQFNVQYVPSMIQYNGYIVTVTDSNSQPVSGARVTFLKDNDAFGTELTGVNGQVLVYVNVNSAGTMNLTVTKPNFIPFEATITVTPFSSGEPRRTSCPYIYTWNGSQFIKDNDILPAGNPMYYKDYYKLMKPLVSKDNKYLINIVDSEDETSWIDMVKLIQVDHPKGTNIAPTPEGEILSYKDPSVALSAIDKNNNSQLVKVNKIENDEEHSYYGEKGDVLIMNFGSIKDKQNGARLIMRTDLKCPPRPILNSNDSLHIYVLMNEKNWQKISVVHPHQFWDEWAVNIPQKYLDKVKGDLKVKIEWTKPHRVDFVGLDTSKQVVVVKSELPLLRAVHSQGKDVLSILEQADNKPAVTVKDQSISLEFSSLSIPTQDRSFILLSAGKYKANK
jgi:hypothetical protein